MGLSLLVAAMIAATPASARQEAGLHYQRAISLYKESNFSAALSEFKAAYAAVPSWEVLFNIGLCQRRLFRYGAAIRSLDRYLAEGGARVPRDRRAAVAEELEQIRALTAPVAVIVKGASATISIDGEPTGATPLSELVLLGPGKHLVRAERAGCAPDERTIEVVSGQAQAVELDPRSLTAPGLVTVECTPAGALVSIDSGAEARCPLAVELAPGTHEVVAQADGYASQRTEVVVQPAEPRLVRLTLVPVGAGGPTRPFPVLGVSLLGGAVVAGGVGAVFALLAQGSANEVTTLAKAGGTWSPQAVAAQAAGQRNSAVGWVLIAAGGAAAAAGVAAIVVNAAQPVQIAVAPGGLGVSVCGSF